MTFFFTHLTEADMAELDKEEHAQDENVPANSSEFKHYSEAELKHLVENNTNSNTKRSTSTWINHFEKWAEHKGGQTDLAKIPKDDLDRTLQQFYAELVKKDGTEYEPESLKVMIAAVDRYVKEKCRYSIIKDKEFEASRKVLNGKAIEL